MPDYLPPLQLPTGLAEEAARLAAQRGQIWGQAFSGIGQNIGQGLLQRHQMLMNKPLDPQQIADIQAGKIPTGLSREQQLTLQAQQASLAERKTAMEEQTNRILAGIQGRFAGTHTTYTQDQWDNLDPAFKKKLEGVGLGPGMAIPNQAIESQVRPASGMAASGPQDEANRKILTDYAAAHNESLDALRPGGMGGWNSANMAMAAEMVRNHPDYDFQKMKESFAGTMAGVTSTARTTAAKSADIRTNLGSAHGGFTASMDEAKRLAEKMGQGKVATFNKMWQAGVREFNDPDSLQFATQISNAINNYARIAKGGSASLSEDDYKHAEKFISDKLNSGGIDAVQKAVETEYKGRLRGLPGGAPDEKTPKTKEPVKPGSFDNIYKKHGLL